MAELLTETEARELVETYIENEKPCPSTQDILDSGDIPRLMGYTVRPGKVSDSIFGGKGSYEEKIPAGTSEQRFENPNLETKDGAPLRIMVRSSRISTHDKLRGAIPFKDQILAMNHNFMRKLVMHALGTSQYDVPGLKDNDIVIAAENLEQIGYENVVRAFMAKSSTSTSLYVHFMNGEREFCGHLLPDNLIPNGPLPYVMDTPSTKSDEHDESVTPEYLFKKGICTPAEYAQLRNASIYAFGLVDRFLRDRGVMLVDTKTEHGKDRFGIIKSQDELYTMDSSRFWLLEDYNEQLAKLRAGEIAEISPRSYSKEFARGFSKGDDGYTPEQTVEIAVRYIMGIQHLLQKRFEPDMRSTEERIISGLETVVNELVA